MGKRRRRRGDHALLILRAIRAGIGRLDAPARHLEVSAAGTSNWIFAINLADPDGWVLSEFGESLIRSALDGT